MKTLLVQTSFLGDTVLSTPVVAAIKKLYPMTELWMMTTPVAATLVKRDPLLTGVIPYDKRGEQRGLSGLLQLARSLREMDFQQVYALHRSFRTALLLRLAGIPRRVGFAEARGAFLYTERSVRYPDSSQDEHDVRRNLRIMTSEGSIDSFHDVLRLEAPGLSELSAFAESLPSLESGYVVLVPGSVWRTKRWFAEGYRDVARHFLSMGKQVLVIGSPGERDVCQQVSTGIEVLNLGGKTSIDDVLSIISRAGLVVCNDSFALHVASAFQIPTVAVFCATSPKFGFGPWQNRAEVVEKEGLACKPCRRHGSQHCPTGTESCMRDLSSKSVIEAAERMYGSASEAAGMEGELIR